MLTYSGWRQNPGMVMKNASITCFLIMALLLWSAVSLAVEPKTEHTFRLSEGEDPPQSSLEDAAWLAGSWTGTAFGKSFEETWNPPSANSMVGLFKLFDEEGVDLYEITLLTVDDGRLSLKVKHFTDEFIAWEDKPDYVNFKLVKVEEDALHFSGISFYRRDDNHIDGYIVMNDDGELSEHKLSYTRVGAK
jgi:hypothetical protein